ncbi:MAG: ATP-binding protein, partial [Bacteroidales bacterium]|nr:ATP-binding protein [Candidatus Cacconaster caballi]
YISTSLLSILVAGVLLSAAAFVFTDSYVNMICYDDDGAVAPYLHTYFRIVGSGTILFLLAQFACEVVNIDGRPSLGTRAIVISVLCNIVFDILLTAHLGLGVAGSAIATLIANTVTIVFLSCSHIFTKACSFTIRIFRQFSVSALKSILKLGGKMSLTSVFSAIFIFIAYFSVQICCDEDGLFALSIGMIVFNICTNLAIGVGRSVVSVGGFLKGQRDWNGFRHIVARSIRVTLAIGFAVSVAVTFCARLLVLTFGADTPEMVAFCTNALRVFIWIVPSSMLVTLMMFIYLAMMNLRLIPVPTISFSVAEIVFLLAWPYLMPSETLWYAIPLASLLSVGIIYLISEIVRHGNSTISRLTHIPKHTTDEDIEQLQLSIPTNMDDTTAALNSIRIFLERQNISDGLENKLVLCLEEIFLNINEHSELKGNGHCYDVIIRMERDGILSVVKDDGRPFNPLIIEEEKRGLGLMILLGICKHVDYQYMYGQNLLFLQFPYE